MILTSRREKQLIETAQRVRQELAAMLWRGNLPRFFYVADVRGRIVDTRPAQEFAGLERLVRTGHREKKHGTQETRL